MACRFLHPGLNDKGDVKSVIPFCLVVFYKVLYNLLMIKLSVHHFWGSKRKLMTC